MSKTAKNMVTRIQQSEKMQPWCKRFFLFMLSQGVECRKSDMQRWNKAVMTQKQRNEKSKTAVGTCSFVVAARSQLPPLQGVAEKALSTLSGKFKKYGSILWFIVIENRVFIIINVYTLKQANQLLSDIMSRQVHNDMLGSLAIDLVRANTRFKDIESLVATFCPSDVTAIQNLVTSPWNSSQVSVEPDEKVSSYPEEAGVRRVAPFTRNQPVEVFSKTSGQWLPANVVCVQEDDDGIFVTVSRIDGHELDYDIQNVRAVRVASIQSEHMPTVSEDEVAKEVVLQNSQNGRPQQGDFAIKKEQTPEYSEHEVAPERMASIGSELYKQQSLRTSNFVISEAEMYKRMETFLIFDKIRSVKNWLRGVIAENEPLPQIIANELRELSEILQKLHH